MWISVQLPVVEHCHIIMGADIVSLVVVIDSFVVAS
jgi:hypothetical protein